MTAVGRESRLARIGLALTLAPLLVAAVRAIRSGWVPVGDSAVIALRSGDVLGQGELPLLGMWSSASWGLGFDVNHPGPLLYDLLAVPARLWPGGAGQVIGATAIAMASVVGIWLVARRQGGPVLALAAMAVTAGLCWAMGAAVVVEPWHANTLLLPFLCFALLSVAVGSGDVACAPWALGVGSLLIQTNLGYAVLVPALLGAALVGLIVRRRDVRVGSPLRLAVVSSLVVLVVLWAQPVAEQLRGSGWGNLSRVIESSRKPMDTLDWSEAVGSVAKVVALPPWWGRPSYADAFPFGVSGNPLPATAQALVGLVVVCGLLLVGWRDARRRGDAVVTGLVTTALVLVAAAVLTANLTPTDLITGTVAYQLRWLWPVAAFVWLALAAAVARRSSTTGTGPGLAAGLLVGLTAMVALLNLPWSNNGTAAAADTLPVARALVGEIPYDELDGPLLVDCVETVWDPYCEAVMYQLERHGVPVVVRTPIGVRQLGEERRWDGTNAVALLRVNGGDWYGWAAPGARRLAAEFGLDTTERRELADLRDQIVAAIAAGELRLNERGERVARQGGFDSSSAESPVRFDPVAAAEAREALFGEHERDLVLMAREHLLSGDGAEWTARLERYADLQEAWDERTVAVSVEEITPEVRDLLLAEG